MELGSEKEKNVYFRTTFLVIRVRENDLWSRFHTRRLHY